MKKTITLSIVFLFALLSGCTNLKDEEEKANIAQDVLDMHRSISYYCLSDGCEEGEELTYNDLFNYIDSSFPDDLYDMESTTVLGKYTEEDIYVYLVPIGNNTFGYEGIVDSNDFSKDDIKEYND